MDDLPAGDLRSAGLRSAHVVRGMRLPPLEQVLESAQHNGVFDERLVEEQLARVRAAGEALDAGVRGVSAGAGLVIAAASVLTAVGTSRPLILLVPVAFAFLALYATLSAQQLVIYRTPGDPDGPLNLASAYVNLLAKRRFARVATAGITLAFAGLFALAFAMR